ncbi:MAG TPA: response regulator transcription factor [Holophagaceae bacterium]
MKILLVEDEVKLARTLSKGLQAENISVDWAEDGLQGLEMALPCCYDAVILDVMLPGLDGLTLLSKIREARCPVPILMLTAKGCLEDKVKGLDLGADDYLSKPFEFLELLARLRALTRRPVVEPQQVLRLADLELDLGTCEARRAGQLIPLTRREFSLLEFLLRRKGLVLSRTMLLDSVWPSDVDYGPRSNLVDVYINNLRKKVDQGREPKLLHTIRGMGYVLRETP